MVREQDAFFVVAPALDFLVASIRRERSSPVGPWLTRACAGAAAFFAAYLPQLVAYEALNGHPRPTDYVTRKMTWTAPHSLQVLFNAEHGFFAWTPLALVALAGLVWLALGRVRSPSPSTRTVAAWMLVMVALQVYVNGSVESWTVAGSFGQRRFVALTPLLVVGLAAAMTWGAERARAARLAGAGVIAICIWWNLGLMIQFGLHQMDRQQLTLRQNAWTTFVELPVEAPAIAWRYLTNRDSFYNLPPQ